MAIFNGRFSGCSLNSGNPNDINGQRVIATLNQVPGAALITGMIQLVTTAITWNITNGNEAPANTANLPSSSTTPPGGPLHTWTIVFNPLTSIYTLSSAGAGLNNVALLPRAPAQDPACNARKALDSTSGINDIF